MTKLTMLLLLAGFGPTALALSPVTVEQVEQLLAANRGQPDERVTKEISGLQLTERVSSARLARWQAEFPGKKTSDALLVLADAAAFFDLPGSEIPAIEKPDSEARRQILQRMVDYVNTTIYKLPNFSTKRTTKRFDDLSLVERLKIRKDADGRSAVPPYISTPSQPQALQIADITAITVTYRNGREVADARADQGRKAELYGVGLTTHGEFGPILSVVVGDAIKGRFFWGRWEQGTAGPMAVFRYRVPQELSHYTITLAKDHPESPAYHGELAIDPANGAILRISVVADLDPAATSDSNPAAVSKSNRPVPTLEASIAVEYGPVTIGDVPYICPIKGVALSRLPKGTEALYSNFDGSIRAVDFAPQTYVNDVAFTQYHLFRADVRILP